MPVARRRGRLGMAGAATAVVTLVVGVAGAASAVSALSSSTGSATASKSVDLRPGVSFTAASGATFADGSVNAGYLLPGRPIGGSAYLGLELRRSGALGYRTKVRILPDGTVRLDVSKVGATAETLLTSRPGAVVVPAGASSTLRTQSMVIGTSPTTLKFRAWLAGAAVPDWQVVVTDSTAPVTGSGKAGAWGYLSRQATSSFGIVVQGVSGAAASSGKGWSVAPTAPAGEGVPSGSVPSQTLPSGAVPSGVTAPGSPAGSLPTGSTSAGASPVDPASPAFPGTGSQTTGPATTSGSGASAQVPGTVAESVSAVLGASGARLGSQTSIPAGAVYVSPNGSDTGTGESGAPLRSVAAAVAKAPSGGTVVLRGGTYRQAVGSVTKPLNFVNYPGEVPVLSGADVVSAWTAADGVWRTTSWASPFGQNDFRAEEVPAGTAAGKVEQVFRNGTPLRQVLTRAELKTGTFWIDPSTLHAYVADNPSGATMEVTQRVRGLTLDAGAAGSVVRGLRFTAYGSPHLDNSGQLVVQAPRARVVDSQFDHSSGAGLKISASDITVDHITVSDNAAEGMQGNRNHNSIVENSQFSRNNTDGFKVSGCGASCTIAGFKTAHTARLTVRNNAFVNNAGNGFWCDLGCTDAVITGNAVSGGYDGIFYEVSARAKITGNYVERADKGIRVSGSTDVTIQDNTLVDNNWQFTVYDDRRDPSADSYSDSLGLSWNTTGLSIVDNDVLGGTRTTKLLESNATAQVANPGMYRTTTGNAVTGNQVMLWCAASSSCTSYPSITAWRAASGRAF